MITTKYFNLAWFVTLIKIPLLRFNRVVRLCHQSTIAPRQAARGQSQGARAGLKASADLRENYTPGHKYSQWELKGVCLRLELGPKDMEKGSVMTVRRDTGAKEAVAWAELAARVPAILDDMQSSMFAKAQAAVTAAQTTVRRPLSTTLRVSPSLCWFARSEACRAVGACVSVLKLRRSKGSSGGVGRQYAYSCMCQRTGVACAHRGCCGVRGGAGWA